LIVDDNPRVRQDLRFLLELSGAVAVVGEASNGMEAIARVETLLPDTLLLDLEMPVMDGYVAAQAIKARWPGCRLIALSVHGYPSAREKARQSGVDAFIEKGASLEAILQVLTQAGN
jgi:DNA-binding NarL/FixJ family response regulator